jgi:cell division protein ZapA
MDTPVEVKIGGFSYRVTGSASEAELNRLAGIVDQRLRALGGPSRNPSPHSLVLVAMTLAHELEEERTARRRVEARSQEMLQSLLERVDAALDADNASAERDDAPDRFEPASPEP